MSFSKEAAAKAIEYISQVKITVGVDPVNGKALEFTRVPEIPDSFDEEIKTILDICIEYHQRSVFTGEYLAEDKNPPILQNRDSLEEMNFLLEHYRHLLIKEAEKGLSQDEEVFDDENPRRVNTPFVKAIMQYRAQHQKKR